MSVPKEYVVRVVGYECYIYECTKIICCLRWWAISCDSMHDFEYIPHNIINVFNSLYTNADYHI